VLQGTVSSHNRGFALAVALELRPEWSKQGKMRTKKASYRVKCR
jgi:hypothetical protein